MYKRQPDNIYTDNSPPRRSPDDPAAVGKIRHTILPPGSAAAGSRLPAPADVYKRQMLSTTDIPKNISGVNESPIDLNRAAQTL